MIVKKYFSQKMNSCCWLFKTLAIITFQHCVELFACESNHQVFTNTDYYCVFIIVEQSMFPFNMVEWSQINLAMCFKTVHCIKGPKIKIYWHSDVWLKLCFFAVAGFSQVGAMCDITSCCTSPAETWTSTAGGATSAGFKVSLYYISTILVITTKIKLCLWDQQCQVGMVIHH